MTFEVGRLVVHRNVRRGRIGWVRPARVVSDDERGLAMWIARGSVIAFEVADDGRGMRAMPFTEWITRTPRVALGTWEGPGVLKFMPAQGNYSVWWFRDADERWNGWYVNLEEPGVRWDDGALAGVDIVDQDLDIVVAPDLTWRWKDEDEFAERLEIPEHYWVDDAEAVWDEGRRVVKLIETGEFPFDGTWCDFAPPASWVPPSQLPEGWDRPPAR
jgi:hypothetical protein